MVLDSQKKISKTEATTWEVPMISVQTNLLQEVQDSQDQLSLLEDVFHRALFSMMIQTQLSNPQPSCQYYFELGPGLAQQCMFLLIKWNCFKILRMKTNHTSFKS